MFKLMSKQKTLLVLIVAFMLVITGCSSSGIDEELSSGEGKINVNIEMPNKNGSESLSALNVTDDLKLSTMEIELINVNDANDTESKSKDVTDEDTVAFNFNDLKNGAEYEIEMKAKDTEDKYVSKGSGSAIAKEEASSTSIPADWLPADGVNVELTNLPEEAETAEVSLNLSDLDTKVVEINSTEETVEFDEEFTASNYDLEVSLFDSSEEEIDPDKENVKTNVPFLPSRVTTLTVDWSSDTGGDGGLEVDIDWDLAPEPPTGLTAEAADDGTVELSWDDTAAEYLVYRGESTDSKMPLIETTISDNSYTDEDIEGDKTYYYWVRGVGDNGLNSDFSEVKEVTTPDLFEGIKIYYKDTSGTPTIWTWEDAENEDDDYEITKEMGYSWDDQPEMTAVDGADDWYVFEIPVEHLSESGLPLGVIFNQGDTLTLDPADTAWYDGSSWSYEPPYDTGPSKPEVAITPTGGTETGDTTIEINIDDGGEDLIASSATFDGQSADISSGSASMTLSDYVADGATATLEVSAENSAGTATETVEFTRDDDTTGPEPTEVDFTWDNANVYFVLTDRFYNGDTSNDESYDRVSDHGSPEKNAGTFHGGDIAGLTDKLEAGYFEELGTNAIWVTAPYEQIHGFVGGGDDSDFAHYSYHGYYPLDFTMMDKNMGTVEEFREFVNTAHEQDIRVVMDIVMNHSGYPNIADGAQYGYGDVDSSLSSLEEAQNWEPSDGNWGAYHDEFFDYDSQSAWSNFWGAGWVRAGFPGYDDAGGDDLTKNLADLPDFKTELTSDQGISPLLETKWSQEDSSYEDWIVPATQDLRQDLGQSPSASIQKWLTAWVEEFGVDGFRVDTAKHVEKEEWGELKGEAQDALETWRANNSNAPGADWDEDFWMTGEVYDHGVNKSGYFDDNDGDGINDFESLINFNFPKDGDLSSIGQTWSDYAEQINSDSDFNVLSYISSHDEGLEALGDKIDVGTALLLAPGGIQTFYGDEVDRQPGAGANTSDSMQGSRSDYPWDSQDTAALEHWQKLGQFRRDNPAVGAGQQIDIGDDTYGRTYDADNDGTIDNKVVIKINGSGTTTVDVSEVFADGIEVANAYDGTTATVNNGTVEFEFANNVILLEQVQ
ncbi:MAG: alpha-amylase family glycosyl hydrolase [Bacillota bacterium]